MSALFASLDYGARAMDTAVDLAGGTAAAYEVTPYRFGAIQDSSGRPEPCICCEGTGGDSHGLCPLCDGLMVFTDYDRGAIRQEGLWEGRVDAGFLLHNLLSAEECDAIVAQAEAFGLEDCGYSSEIRVTDRVVVMGEELGRLLFKRARPFLEDVLVESLFGCPEGVSPSLPLGRWRPTGMNPCFRVCRYKPGGFFKPHHDGGFDVSSRHRSIKTFMVYLNDGFGGGRTTFYDERQPRYCSGLPGHATYALQPAKGSCLVFNHKITHDGGELTEGLKFILRTEVMYEQVSL